MLHACQSLELLALAAVREATERARGFCTIVPPTPAKWYETQHGSAAPDSGQSPSESSDCQSLASSGTVCGTGFKEAKSRPFRTARRMKLVQNSARAGNRRPSIAANC